MNDGPGGGGGVAAENSTGAVAATAADECTSAISPPLSPPLPKAVSGWGTSTPSCDLLSAASVCCLCASLKGAVLQPVNSGGHKPRRLVPILRSP